MDEDPLAYFDRLLGALRSGPDVEDALQGLIHWPEFWERDHQQEQWLAWPLIPAGRQVAMYAPAKTGKSIVVLAAVAALAAGRSIFGRPAQPRRSVLYLDYEMTDADLYDRLEALGYGPDIELGYLHYALLPTLPALNTIAGRNAVVELAAKVEAELVVIDTMGRAVIGEENSADPYREFARLTGLALKADGRAVFRTDHAGKTKESGQRGSSAKNDDVDVVLRLDATEGGWSVTRTHTRISWVPERTILTRAENTDGYVSITVAEDERRVYRPGTKELADELRALGITAETGRRQAAKAAREAGVKAAEARIGDALAWLRDELPTFPNGRVPPPETPHLSTGPGTDGAPLAPDHETAGQDTGTTSGDSAYQGSATKRVPPPTSNRGRGVSQSGPDLAPEDLDRWW